MELCQSWENKLLLAGVPDADRLDGEEKGPLRLKARALQAVRRSPVFEVLGLALDFEQYFSVSDISSVKETLFLN